MNILVVSQYYYPEQFRINDICEELVSRGHKVTVVTGQPNYPEGTIYKGYEERYNETVNGVNIERCKIRSRGKGTVALALNFASYVISARKHLKNNKSKYDVVYIYQLSPVTSAIPGIIYSKKNGIPSYLYCCDIWPESIRDIVKCQNSIGYLLVKRVSSVIYRQADKIGIKSKSFEDYLIEVCGVEKARIEYIPEHAEQIYSDIDLSAERNGIVDFMFLGNIGLSQNCELIVEATAILKDVPGFKVHFVGDGSSYEKIKALVLEKNIGGLVEFHGRHSLSEMPYYYRLADVCLLTLLNENAIGLTLPSKLVGYMGAGKPVVASIDGDAAEAIKEANCGYCVKANDVTGFASAMYECIKNPTQLFAMSKSAKEYFKANFDRDKCIDKLQAELIAIAKSKGKKNNV